MQLAKIHFQAFLWFAGLIGSISTVWGLVASDFWEIFSALGYIGFIAVWPLYVVWTATGEEWKRKYLVFAVVASLALGALLHLLFPFRDDENVGQFNLLALIGMAFVVGLFFVGVGLYRAYEGESRAAMKQCPDCANHVLAPARKCQFCGYHFVSGE